MPRWASMDFSARRLAWVFRLLLVGARGGLGGAWVGLGVLGTGSKMLTPGGPEDGTPAPCWWGCLGSVSAGIRCAGR